jgi:hypothetical protein
MQTQLDVVHTDNADEIRVQSRFSQLKTKALTTTSGEFRSVPGRFDLLPRCHLSPDMIRSWFAAVISGTSLGVTNSGCRDSAPYALAV